MFASPELVLYTVKLQSSYNFIFISVTDTIVKFFVSPKSTLHTYIVWYMGKQNATREEITNAAKWLIPTREHEIWRK